VFGKNIQLPFSGYKSALLYNISEYHSTWHHIPADDNLPVHCTKATNLLMKYTV